MKIEEYRFRWGYEKSVQSGILKLKTSRIFYKNCKTFVFLPSLDTPKKNWGVPCPIACNRIWCTMSNTWHDLRLWANAAVGDALSILVFNAHSSRHSSLVTFEVIMSTLHTFLLSSVDGQNVVVISEWNAECCSEVRRVECYCDCTTRNFRHTNDDFIARCDWLISATTIAPPWTGLTEN